MPLALALLLLYGPVSRLIPPHQPQRKCSAYRMHAVDCSTGWELRRAYHPRIALHVVHTPLKATQAGTFLVGPPEPQTA
jgi:hypothetical protein